MAAHRFRGALLTLVGLQLVACGRSTPASYATSAADPPRTFDAAPGAVHATLYAQGWGLVAEVRSLTLTAGDQRVRFPGVAIHAEPSVSYLQVPGTVASQRFLYDLASRELLLSRYDGRTVELYPPGATASVTGTLWVTGAGVMVRVGDRLYSVAPERIVLPDAGGLDALPTLEWAVSAPAAWSGLATASYEAMQLGWHNSYTLETDAEQTKGHLQQWARLYNTSDAELREASVTLVAGDVRRGGMQPVMAPYAAGRSYAEVSAPESYSGRYQYTLPERLTLAPKSDVRRLLMDRPEVALTKTYWIENWVSGAPEPQAQQPRKPGIRLTAAGGVDVPVPHGAITVWTPNSQGQLAIVGEPGIPDTPRDQAFRLELGEAFDVTLQRTQTLFRTGTDSIRVGYRLVLRNREPKPVTVEVLERMSGDWEMVAASMPFDTPSAAEARFQPRVDAGGEVTITYEVRIRREPQRVVTVP